MRSGAVAFVDALGFKGIHKEVKFERILDKLRTVENVFAEDNTERQIVVRTAFISDTVIIAAWPSDGVADSLSSCVYEVAMRIASILHLALLVPPQLVFRGAMAFGEFKWDGSFLIGPAVDEAAEWHQKPNGAFVVCPPETAQTIQAARDSSYLYTTLLTPYDVPIKRCNESKCLEITSQNLLCVNYSAEWAAGNWDENIKRVRVAFERGSTNIKPDVKDKLKATLTYLEHTRQFAA